MQIFAEEIHPNVIKGPGRSKEGFSIFGLFDRTQSISGAGKIRVKLRLKVTISKTFSAYAYACMHIAVAYKL